MRRSPALNELESKANPMLPRTVLADATLVDADAGSDVPTPLIATTLTWYRTVEDRPETVHVVAPVVVQVFPPGEIVTRYPVMIASPGVEGLLHDTVRSEPL
jgi:hypothetical protein